MLEIGRTNSLEVLREAPMGLILGRPEFEVLLPTRYVPEGSVIGDVLDVFVYTDSEDRPIATTEVPLVQADEFACLRVESVNRTGAFLDWGLPKDLLLPFRSQLSRLRPEQRVVVRVFCDRVSRRMVASTKVENFLSDPPDDLSEGQSVRLLVYEETELGSKAIVDDEFSGLLYCDPASPRPEVGSTPTGYVQRIRPDGKVDLSLTPSGKDAADGARDVVLAALRAAGGRLALSDSSAPDEIRDALGLSKKAFKRAVGTLYKQRQIRIGERGIELVMAKKPTRGPRPAAKNQSRPKSESGSKPGSDSKPSPKRSR